MKKPGPSSPPSSPSTIGPGGCLLGFVLGGGVLAGGEGLLTLMGVRGGARTLLELAVMGLALAACLFLWKVAATADQMARAQPSDAKEQEIPKN